MSAVLMRQRKGSNLLPDIFGYCQSCLDRRVRPDQSEFFTTIASSQIRWTPGILAENLRDLPQHLVTSLMTIIVIEGFEMVDIK